MTFAAGDLRTVTPIRDCVGPVALSLVVSGDAFDLTEVLTLRTGSGCSVNIFGVEVPSNAACSSRTLTNSPLRVGPLILVNCGAATRCFVVTPVDLAVNGNVYDFRWQEDCYGVHGEFSLVLSIGPTSIQVEEHDSWTDGWFVHRSGLLPRLA